MIIHGVGGGRSIVDPMHVGGYVYCRLHLAVSAQAGFFCLVYGRLGAHWRKAVLTFRSPLGRHLIGALKKR